MNGEGGQESSKAEMKMATEAEMVSNRWVFAGGVYLCVQECQLTAERLVLKLHPQKRFPEALVNTEAFFLIPLLQVVTRIPFEGKAQREAGLRGQLGSHSYGN